MSAVLGEQTVTIKSGDLFFLSEPGGDVPLERGHALGLFYHDCRFLNGYTLTIDGRKPQMHGSASKDGHSVTLRLLLDEQSLAKDAVEILWSREVSSEQLALMDVIALQSLTNEAMRFSVALNFQSEFEDLFALRGMAQAKRGRLHPPVWENGALHFLYEGADQIDRELTVDFSPRPSDLQHNSAQYQIELAPRECERLRISLLVSESSKQLAARPRSDTESCSLSNARTRISSDSESFNRVMDRSLGDLEMLRCGSGSSSYFAAGVPWYVALFGRDSVITALQMLAYDTQIAEHTIRLLAQHQGKEVNEGRDEEPGKILHELRVGEMANLNEIPHTPYYGTIDATPLWLVLVGRHAAWTGNLRIFNELRTHVEAALNWIDRYGDRDDDGYVEYQCKSERGLLHQGWKDSADGIVNADGSLGEPPIALAEVQGYVYRAKLEIALLFRKTGDETRAAILENEAQHLCERFNRDFWVDDGYYALALQNGKRHVAVLSSNTGQVLWSGIADIDHANETAEHLLWPDMFTGWGIRTLSSEATKYNPVAYHLGTVWPHDNSLIVAGLKNYGFDRAALRVLTGMTDAAQHFEGNRLPELFGGFAREKDVSPARYPIACQPQAWAAGAVPYMVTSILGLEPDAFEARLRIVRPMLPKNVNRMEICDLRVGAASVDLIFERSDDGVSTRVQGKRGVVEIITDAMV